MITHADGSRVSIAIIASVILTVCPHDKTKTAETKIAKLGTRIVRHDTLPGYRHQLILGEKVKGQDHKV